MTRDIAKRGFMGHCVKTSGCNSGVTRLTVLNLASLIHKRSLHLSRQIEGDIYAERTEVKKIQLTDVTGLFFIYFFLS